MIEEISENGSNEIIDAVTDAADLAISASVSAPVSKNFVKALWQLCAVVVDIPVTLLEGKTAEMRAESNARVKIIETGGSQIAEKMDVTPEYAKVVVKKYGQKIVREQVNLDQIMKVAICSMFAILMGGNR